jgi:hypothetical protein
MAAGGLGVSGTVTGAVGLPPAWQPRDTASKAKRETNPLRKAVEDRWAHIPRGNLTGKNSPLPAPVVDLRIGLNLVFDRLGDQFLEHRLVDVFQLVDVQASHAGLVLAKFAQ